DPAKVAEVAHHHRRSGQLLEAFLWDLRSARTAEQVGAFAEAAECYRRILDDWEDIPSAGEMAGGDRIDVLLQLARAEELSGDVTGVRASIEEALRLVDRTVDATRAVLVLERLSWAMYIAGRPSDSLRAARAAVSLATRELPGLVRVAALTGLGRA